MDSYVIRIRTFETSFPLYFKYLSVNMQQNFPILGILNVSQLVFNIGENSIHNDLDCSNVIISKMPF